jgi:hypothetical protein
MKHYPLSPRTTAVGCVIAAILWSASPAQGQDALQQIKSLYASAAYEEALTILGRLQSGQRPPELEQYRVFCLVALGRIPEAERAISSVVVQNPSFLPDAAEAPPRIREMFSRLRRTLVPEIAHRLYVEARASFDRKDRLAESQFEALVRLIDSTPHVSPTGEDEEPMLTELRLLAAGFLDLSRALRAAPAESAPSPRVVTRVQGPEVTPPVPVRQDLPTWVPADLSSRLEFRGAIRVLISEVGRVTDAELSPPIHPSYDRLLLHAAKSWAYQPALKNGMPIASEKTIEVVLNPSSAA